MAPEQIDQDIEKRLEEVKELEAEGRRRKFSGAMAVGVTVIAIAFALFHMWRAYVGPMGALQQRSIHLTFALVLTFLVQPFLRRMWRQKLPWWDLILVGLGILVGVYLLSEYEELTFRIGTPNTLDLALGIICVFLVLEATRRLIGWPLPIIAFVFLLYAYFGEYAPGFFAHRGYDFHRIISHMYLTTEGIFGLPLGVSATFVILFIVMGAFLQESGAGQFFFEFAYSLLGRVRGGPAKMSVVSSGLFGTISGSAVANVVVDGWITIPMMKRVGYRAHVAAAVEATASTGGQLMPPVMGAAAFIIAEILGIGYIQVCIAATIPAILYYTTLFCMVDLEAAKMGLQGLPASELPRFRKVFLKGWHLLVPLFVLIFFLVVLDWSPMKSALWAIILTPFIGFLRISSRMDLRKITRALEQGALGVLEVALACACAGIVVGIFSLTGLGMKLSTMLIEIAGGSLLALLFLTMIASIILGMGMPTTACYIVLAVLVAPALIKMGVVPLAAHLFVFYFGIISAITPPVALAAYAAAGIGNTDPFKSGWYATKLGLAGFVIPYMFVYGPALLFEGRLAEVLLASISGLIGAAALAAAIQGWILERLSIWQRVLLGVAGLCLIKPGWITDALGGILLALVVGLHFFVHREANRRQLALESIPLNPPKSS